MEDNTSLFIVLATFILQTDASDRGVGAVLSPGGVLLSNDDKWRCPVA